VLVLAIRILEGMFVVGALGCVLVLVFSAIDDFRVLFGRDDDKAMNPADGQTTGEAGRTNPTTHKSKKSQVS
jgi:hypothetical protein